MNCNDTMTFLMERKRMCELNISNCWKCPAKGLGCTLVPSAYSEYDHKNLLNAVKKWSDEYPVKTYKDDFLEKFPKAPLNGYGIPLACRKCVYENYDCQGIECGKCWNEPMKDKTK